MPNHVTNIVTFKGDENRIREILESIMDKELGIGSFDFDKVIPMPETLNIPAGSETDRGMKLYMEFVETYFRGRELSGRALPNEELLNIPEKSEVDYLDARKDIVKETFSLGKKAFQNKIKYGCATWYDWCIENWGTKWNSYGYEDLNSSDEDFSIRFLTAWSAPHPVLDKLAQMYPDIEIVHEWADEDIGYNLGRYSYGNGERIEEYFPESEKECVEFAERVTGYDITGDDIQREVSQ